MRAARRLLGGLLIGATAATVAVSLRAVVHYIVPHVGPVGWVMVAAIGTCSLMVAAPLLSQGIVLLNPRLAEEPVRAHRPPRQPPRWPDELPVLPDGEELLRGTAPAPPPRLSERYGYDPVLLATVAGTTAVGVAVGLLVMPTN